MNRVAAERLARLSARVLARLRTSLARRGRRPGRLNDRVAVVRPLAAVGASGPDWRAWRRLTERRPLRQPDATSCGSCSLVMAHLITGGSAGRDVHSDGDDARTVEAFEAAVRGMHRRTGSPRDDRGRWSVPWPPFLGTQPWAAAREMSATIDFGDAPVRYRVRFSDPVAAAADYDRLARAVDGGAVVPLYVGDALMARHVVLVTGHHTSTDDGRPADGLDVYEPSAGRWIQLPRSRYVSGGLDVAGWDQSWFAVLPTV